MNLQETQSTDPAKFEEEFNRNNNLRSDQLIERFLVAYFLFGIAIAYFYDTWLIALTVGVASLLLYFVAKKMFPGKQVHHYMAGLAFGVYMAQFIYQMHGLFEMHFFAFIGSTLLITYQNWKVQLPIAIFVVVHHAIFGYLQYSSFSANKENTIYFTQLDYMTLQTFIIHGLLATVVFFICGLWAYEMKKRTKSTIENSKNIFAVAQVNDSVVQNLEYAVMLSNGMIDEKIEFEEGDVLGEALSTIQQKLSGKK
jgi:hypothetical protein